MSRWERSGTRDLLFSGWHRTLPDYCTTIDLDFVEYCQSCHQILGLLELTFDKSKRKATTILEQLAADANADAFVLYLEQRDGELVGAEVGRVFPSRDPLEDLTEPQLREWFVELHDYHRGAPCAGARAATAHRKRRAA